VKGTSVADSEKYLPFIPPLHGTSELRFDFEIKSAKIKHAFVKAQMEYYGNQDQIFSAYGTETHTPGYTLFNAGVGGSFANKEGKTICSLYIMGNNLFDNAYQDHLSRLKYFEPYPTDPRAHGIYNMGRNISFKLDFPFNYNLKKS
jgi:iron complex outermembrane receptor protein